MNPDFTDALAAFFRSWRVEACEEQFQDEEGDWYCRIVLRSPEGCNSIENVLDDVERINSQYEEDVALGDVEGAFNALPLAAQKQMVAKWVRRV